MDTNRENYYVLLGLDASISDQIKIEAKINEMERKWKDLVTKLNKPEHKRLLELVPDIRKRMLNPETRRAEAKTALIVSAIDPAKHEAARKALPESYVKIEEALKHNNFTDIYDFLSRNPADGKRMERYNTTDNAGALIERAKGLMEAYRNLADAADKMRLASLVIDFLNNDKKEAYDTFIMINTKIFLCDSIDMIVKYNDDNLNSESLAKLTSEYTRLYFAQKDVIAFINDYCDYRRYTIIKTTGQPKPAPKEPQPQPAEQKKSQPPPPKPTAQEIFTANIKRFVKSLQQNTERFKAVINKQRELITSQKMEANNVKGYKRKQYMGRVKGMVMHQFAFKEYIDLCCVLAKSKTITDKEIEFYDLYKSMLQGNSAELEQMVFIREYLFERYGEQIEQLMEVNADEIIQRMAVISID